MVANQYSEAARARLLATPGEPFLFADWENVVFLHFTISPDVVRPHVPRPFELEPWHDRAWLSLVALTMRRFRPGRRISTAALFGCLSFQRFLNFRTYARAGSESGALFLHGWFSQPWGLPWPSGRFGFPYAFARSAYEDGGNAQICGNVCGTSGSLSYVANRDGKELQLAGDNAGALPTEFLLERYSGFFVRGGRPCVFRAWHRPWLQITIRAEISDASLVTSRFPWFEQARFEGASFSPGFSDVWLGRIHRLEEKGHGRRVLSAFFEMP